MSTCLSLFKRDFAKARHGVTPRLEEFILVTKSSSQIRTASSKTWLRGKTVKQSKTEFRTNFIISAFLMELPNRKSKVKPVGMLCAFVNTLWMHFNFSNIESGRYSKLSVFSVQVGLFVENLQKKNEAEPKTSTHNKFITQT